MNKMSASVSESVLTPEKVITDYSSPARIIKKIKGPAKKTLKKNYEKKKQRTPKHNTITARTRSYSGYSYRLL